MTTYRSALDCIVEAAGLPLPTGYDRWAIKSTSADLSTRNGFRWAFPGKVTKVPASGIDKTNHGPCPRCAGDGISVGLTYAGMASGGYPARTVLLVAVRNADVLGEEGNKLRVRAALTVDLLDGERIVRERMAGADLHGAHLSRAHLGRADLAGAHLRGANLAGADLRGAHLGRADLAGADLRGADLAGADLRGAYLSLADLAGADLHGANLSRAYLAGAHLRGANLAGAHLSLADLRDAPLGRANLHGANLAGAHLAGAHLRGANLHRAYGEPAAWPAGYDPEAAGWRP